MKIFSQKRLKLPGRSHFLLETTQNHYKNICKIIRIPRQTNIKRVLFRRMNANVTIEKKLKAEEPEIKNWKWYIEKDICKNKKCIMNAGLSFEKCRK